MPDRPLPETAVAPTAARAVLAGTRRHLPRAMAWIAALCPAIATLLWAFDGSGFGAKLVYVAAISLSTWVIAVGGRLLIAAAGDGWRRWRGRPAAVAGFDNGLRALAPAMLAAMLAGPPLGLAIGDRLTGGESPSLLRLDASNTRITMALTLIAAAASVFVLGTLERLARVRAQAESAQRQAAESQLKLLQSQLEPHMLFNTLANLRVLIALDPPRAQAMLDRLIAYLRSTLAASRSDRHALAAEFDRIADYLALMGVRMGERLAVRLTLPPELAALPVPPLLLQPLVENSIQHGLEPQVEGGRIEVGAAREGRTLVLEVRDNGLGLSAAGPKPGGGFGLAQVRERLATLYGERARLTVAEAAGGGTLARVELPLSR